MINCHLNQFQFLTSNKFSLEIYSKSDVYSEVYSEFDKILFSIYFANISGKFY